MAYCINFKCLYFSLYLYLMSVVEPKNFLLIMMNHHRVQNVTEDSSSAEQDHPLIVVPSFMKRDQSLPSDHAAYVTVSLGHIDWLQIYEKYFVL